MSIFFKSIIFFVLAFSSSPAALATLGLLRKKKKIQRPIGFLRLNATNRKAIRLRIVVVRVAAATVEVQDVAVVTVARVLRRRPIVAVGWIIDRTTATVAKSRQKAKQ